MTFKSDSKQMIFAVSSEGDAMISFMKLIRAMARYPSRAVLNVAISTYIFASSLLISGPTLDIS